MCTVWNVCWQVANLKLLQLASAALCLGATTVEAEALLCCVVLHHRYVPSTVCMVSAGGAFRLGG